MFKIYDNFLSDGDFVAIQSYLMGENFPWYYNSYISTYDQKELYHFQFVHIFYDHHSPQSNAYSLVEPIIDKIKPKSLIRIKGNLSTIRPDQIEGGFHTDYNFHCTTAVFYVNTNNGYTLFESGDKIESIQNRLVTFPSHYRHTSVSQTDTQVRCVLNFNYF